MRRGKDNDWNVYDDAGNTSWEKVQIIVMMDIRDELKALNSVLGCHNAIRIPRILDQIEANTKRPKRKAKVSK